ncbi:hypothetical protein, partial [Streptomyces acidiscabies]|uniref:hypothetical protein n=1 Tax=Streptomyces acidiscabies TaxID=42234 RepID=UPI0038F6DB16
MTAPSPTAGQPASAHPADGTLETGGSFIRYDDAATMAGAVAAAMAADLAAALTRRPAASLVVSGGRTP